MNPDTDQEIQQWYSTYGMLTAQRILEGYKIKLAATELVNALQNPESFYCRLLKLPLRNVYNGIILQQAKDYQLFAQKLFIDYLLSGESNKPEEAPGAMVRQDLEEQRNRLLEMNNYFHDLELEHESLITHTQKSMIKDSGQWQKILEGINKSIQKNLPENASMSAEKIYKTLNILLTHYNFESKTAIESSTWKYIEKSVDTPLSDQTKHIFLHELQQLAGVSAATESDLKKYSQNITDMAITLGQARSDFYNFIIHSNALLNSLPEYQRSAAKVSEHQESLQFDSNLGS